MRNGQRISVVIPALNEERSVGKVLSAIPEWVDEVIVVDNGSKDDTVAVAEKNGARVVHEAHRGYGAACLRGIAALDRADVVVFVDADFSDHPEQMDSLVDPIVRGEAEMVIGSRVLGTAEPGALTPQARFGNRLACYLMRLFWGVRYTDLGPFRAIRHETLRRLEMADRDYGWTVEMQIKAALRGLPATEVPVDYRKRIGRSKISGTVRGVVGAGYKILSTIFIAALRYHLGGGKAAQEHDRIIVFTRYPIPGSTKTRLIPALGPEGAAELQRAMTEHTVRTALEVSRATLEIRFTDGDSAQMSQWLGPAIAYRPQAEGDLGERMREALAAAFAEGLGRATIIGIDSPEISAGIHEAAFRALRSHDLVLGPATDGGYYLIGMRRAAADIALPAIFEGIEWGAENVLESTLLRAKELGLRVWRLAPLDDVDRPEDLAAWDRARGDATGDRPALSIVIPTLNEADYIADTLEAIPKCDSIEVIVVDCGSEDETRAIAEDWGAKVLERCGGRAAQMNLGSAKARGATLLFLHADTHLPKDFAARIEDCLTTPGTVAGAFEFATRDPGAVMRLIAAFANFRARRLRLPYGDQGLFMRKDVFRALGGYKDMPIMDDFELVRRLAGHGRVRIAPAKAYTSTRRWRALGPLRTTLLNQVVVLMYFFGASPARLAAVYNRARGR